MLFVSIVLDGVGVGDAPDAAAYGDAGSDTLGHVCAASHPRLPNLARLGLGRIRPLDGVAAVPASAASWGRLTETAAGKDSTTGHWELAGLVLHKPFPLYPDGFPPALVASDGTIFRRAGLTPSVPACLLRPVTTHGGCRPTYSGSSDHFRCDTSVTHLAVSCGWLQPRLTPPMYTPMARYGDRPQAAIAASDGAVQVSNAGPEYQVAAAAGG